MDEKEILFQVLIIIGYQDNKLNFVNQFFAYIYIQTIGEMMDTLDPKSHSLLAKALQNPSDEVTLKKTVEASFSKKEFDKRLETITTTQFTDYLDSIYPTLSPNTQEKLTTYLATLPKPN